MLRVIPIAVSGVKLTTLYSFKNGNDGANPNGLVQASNGNLYGTANSGGANDNGTVFKITTDGALTTLHAFTGENDGAVPKAGLIQAADGNLYGTTYYGGANSGGTTFKMSTSGALTTLHAFRYGNGGSNPFAGLVQASDGTFYGTTWDGGDTGNGTVFKMTSNGSLTFLHGFRGGDGANPRSDLVEGLDGQLYGITRNGGQNPYDGTVFKISTTGTLTTLIHGTNTFSPRGGLIQGSDGSIYGTTVNDGAHGHGTVFKINSTGVLTVLHSFDGAADGLWPFAAPVEGKDGYFYGTTGYGGSGLNGSALSGQGTVFRISPNGAFTTLLYFDGFNGANPSAPLVQAFDGSFYGTTMNGGANGDGTVFHLSVPVAALDIALSNGQIVLSWAAWADDLLLQQTSDLSTGEWTAVTIPLTVTNEQNQIILSFASSGNTFFRLEH